MRVFFQFLIVFWSMIFPIYGSSKETGNLEKKVGVNELKITINNEFVKDSKQFLSKKNESLNAKICIKNSVKCTETVEIEHKESHEFILKKSDPKFSSIFTSDGRVRQRTLEFFPMDEVVCGHENLSDKHFFPSSSIPHDGANNKLPVEIGSIEITLHKMLASKRKLGKWGYAYCSIVYKNKKEQATRAILNYDEIESFCDETEPTNRIGLYPYAGFLPGGYALAAGLWDEDLLEFSIEKIMYRNLFYPKKEICGKIENIRVEAEAVKKELYYEEIRRDFEHYKNELIALKVWGFFQEKIAGEVDYLDTLLYAEKKKDAAAARSKFITFIEKKDLRIILKKGQLPTLPKGFEKLDSKDKIEILDSLIETGEELVSEMKSEVRSVQIKATLLTVFNAGTTLIPLLVE